MRSETAAPGEAPVAAAAPSRNRATDSVPGRRPAGRRGSGLAPWLMSAPALIGLSMFVVLPLLMGAYWSLTDKRLISPLPTRFIALDNYRELLGLTLISLQAERHEETGEIVRDGDGAPVYPASRSILRGDERYRGFRQMLSADLFGRRHIVAASDPTFYRSLLNILLFVLVIVPGQGGLALLLALLVNRKLPYVNAFRAAYFSPVVTSMAVIAIVWTFLYNPRYGLINEFLNAVTFGAVGEINWLTDPRTALPAIIILSAWQAAGFQMVIFLAGLQQIPQVLYEAAVIDGAGPWQRFRYVTWPQLNNTTVFVVISTTILAFRLFTQIDVMTKGGPLDSTVTVVFYAVQQGFRQQRIGYASAITVLFFLLVTAIALSQKAILRSDREIA